MATTRCQCIASSTGLQCKLQPSKNPNDDPRYVSRYHQQCMPQPQPSQSMKINRSVENYLQNTDNPRLLLACGHIKRPNRDLKNTEIDLRGQFLHDHTGWYTIDSDPMVNPDMVANLENPSVLDYLSLVFRNCLNVIYVEGWFFTTGEFFRMIHSTLVTGGTFIQSIGKNSTPQHLTNYVDVVLLAGFTKQEIVLKSFSTLSGILSSVRKAQIHNLETLTDDDFFKNLLSVTQRGSIEELSIRFARLRLDGTGGDLKKVLDDLKLLYKIDPFLGYGLSYEFDRWQCYMLLIKTKN